MTGDAIGKGAEERAALPFSALVFALGLFALVTQTLLFRDYLFSFEGNELGIGSFFGSWLTWVAIGALLGRVAARKGKVVSGSFPLLTLLYLPAFLIQRYLIGDIRALAGVAPYEVFPLGKMVAVSAIANAPLSFLTGFLFTAACVAAPRGSGLPVARVYVFEALGGFAGGLLVTLLLWAGAAEETVFLAAAIPLAGSVSLFHARVRRGSFVLRLAVPVLLGAIIAVLAIGLDRRWADHRHRSAWERFLPAESFRGSFTTAQGRYFHGEREGQIIIVSAGGVVEMLPNEEHASEIVAAHLAQHPAARNVMVVGGGALAICSRFRELPGIDRVVWLHPDPDYPRALLDLLPQDARGVAGDVEVPGVDVREYIEDPPCRFDLILLGLPDVTSLVLNRYATREFFAQLEGVLAPGGVVSVRISGGENYLGGELAYLGSSMLASLEATFDHVVLEPGDESHLIASDGEGLETSPAVLRDRFASIPGAAGLYPPEGLLGLYLPDRIEFQMEAYRRRIAETDEEILINTERAPKALLYGLAVGLRRTGAPGLAGHLPVLLVGLSWITASGILLYALLRLVYLLRSRSVPGRATDPQKVRLFDATFLVLSTGTAGMAIGIVLMFLYQARFGSLFLNVGLLSSLFMLGLSLGGAAIERLLARPGREPIGLLPSCVGLHLAVILLVLLLPAAAPKVAYVLLFVLAGAVTGSYFPIGARRHREAGRAAAAAGSTLEMVDHLGGAVGAVASGLVLLPVCGTQATLGLVAILAAVNLLPGLVPIRGARRVEGDLFDRTLRPAAYWAIGVATFFLIGSGIAAAVRAGREGELLAAAAARLVPDADLRPQSATSGDGGVLSYFTVPDPKGDEGGYIFGTRLLAGDIHGYGGAIDMAVHVDGEGVLQGYRILRSRETPAYLAMVEEWGEGLAGREIFGPAPFEGVDAVTGATMTSDGITRTLEKAGRGFAGEVLGREVGEIPVERSRRWVPDVRFLCLLGLAAAAIAWRRIPRRWLRRLLLLTMVFVAGVWLNLQYSTQQVFSVLGLRLPAIGMSAAFSTVVIVPVLVILLGNVYCGYMCPFGALQELLGDLGGRRTVADPRKFVWRWGRAVKYVLLALLAVAFALTGEYEILAADPLVTIFSSISTGIRNGWAFGLGIAALLLSVVFRRFWCRNLCVPGAFLALLNRVKLLRRLVPPVYPARCDMGVRRADDLDCLGCDRCRHEME